MNEIFKEMEDHTNKMVCGCLNYGDKLCDQCVVAVDQARLIGALMFVTELLETHHTFNNPARILGAITDVLKGHKDVRF